MPLPDLIRRFDIAGPRYTSYPTADRFVEAFDAESQAFWLGQIGCQGVAQPLSVYVHIPFCESVCYYCACNKIVTRHHSQAVAYRQLLEREIDLNLRAITAPGLISQLHLGGGTPTFMADPDIEALLLKLTTAFGFTEDAERSIEVDPRTVDTDRLKRLADMGFNRISFGVQDFDAQVQKAVHRVQSTDAIFALVEASRKLRFQSVNIDLIYGLPLQTPESFERTLDEVVRLRADRIALYGYAHLPERFKPQRRIHVEQLPPPADKLTMQHQAIARLEDAGYVHIGMDHFALPDDGLAVAMKRGMLHRNFMGYTTQPDRDMLGLGVSSIGRVGPTYAQNHRTLDEYRAAIEDDQLPIARGLVLSHDDLMRRFAIMSLMCNGQLSFETIRFNFLVDAKLQFERELEALGEFQRMGLLEVSADGVQVNRMGRFFLRPIAMVFDRYFRDQQQRAQFSRVL